MKLPRAAQWGIFAACLALSAWPARRHARLTQGFDARAYIGAAYNLDKGRSIYSDAGFTLRLKSSAGTIEDVYFPPFLYHPAIAWLYQGAMRATHYVWSKITKLTNLACYIALSAGFIALLFAIGWPPAAVGLAQAALWWCYLIPFSMLFGNAGPVMAGLALLGAAAIAGRRPALAGALLGAASLFKPTIWLIGIALALLWRSDAARREKEKLLIAWLAFYAAATLALAAGPGLGAMGEYAAMLARTGSRAWCISFADASVGATLLRAITPWRPDYHGMMLFSINTVPASVGRWRHDDLILMQAANLLALGGISALAALRWRELRREPLAIAALAILAGFICQPANWPHNYGMLAAAPAAIFFMLRPRESGALDPDRARRIARMGWEAAALLILALWPVTPLLVNAGYFAFGEIPNEPTDAALRAWHIARMLNSLPTIWLLGMTALLFGAAAERGKANEERASPENSG